MPNGLAVLIQMKNDAQKKLVRDVPTMIDNLSLMIENNIGNDSTREMLLSFGNGYVKYGRLTDKQLAVLKNTILQYSEDIQEIISDSREVHEEQKNTGERQPGEESSTDDDVDPFA